MVFTSVDLIKTSLSCSCLTCLGTVFLRPNIYCFTSKLPQGTYLFGRVEDLHRRLGETWTEASCVPCASQWPDSKSGPEATQELAISRLCAVISKVFVHFQMGLAVL